MHKLIYGKVFSSVLINFSKKVFHLRMRLRSGKALLEMARPNLTNNSSASNTQSNVQTTQEQSTQAPVSTVSGANVSTALGVTARMPISTLMGVTSLASVSTMASLKRP